MLAPGAGARLRLLGSPYEEEEVGPENPHGSHRDVISRVAERSADTLAVIFGLSVKGVIFFSLTRVMIAV
jgi:hypothetical protein